VTCISSGITSYTTSVYVPAITGPGLYTVANPPSTICDGADFYVSTCGASTTYSVASFYGDGMADTTALTTTGVRHADIFHHYGFPGTYSVRQILYDGSLAVDSNIFSYNYLYCSTIPLSFYFDANSNCIDDAGETNYSPLTVEVDSSGVPIDTITTTSGLYYLTYGGPGTIYAFKIIGLPAGIVASCPSTGIVYDTILSYVNLYSTNHIGLYCVTVPAFDLSVHGTTSTGPASQYGAFYVHNDADCYPVGATVTLSYSPKYVYSWAYPIPASTAGNTITWNLTGLASTSSPRFLNYMVEYNPSTGYLTLGDTVYESVRVDPFTGDIDTANNVLSILDTVNASYDPNYIAVNPSGYITAGTQLQYTVHFENTGTDTAFNIHVMDTLSNYEDARSLMVVGASAEMNLTVLHVGALNIAKFDFPNINLLDSSHHGQCDGVFDFKINTLAGLAPGTIIPNRAGIYFDYNAAVMTNTVNNIISTSTVTTVTAVNKKDKVALYPNPANDELIIKMDNEAYTSFVITNQVGQQLIQQHLANTGTKVNIKELPAGVYYMTLKGDNGTAVKKFVKM
jgi:hypothetical protein